MATDQDTLEKAKSLVDSALASSAMNFAAKPCAAIGPALKLGAAVALALLQLAEDVREIRYLCENGEECRGDCKR